MDNHNGTGDVKSASGMGPGGAVSPVGPIVGGSGGEPQPAAVPPAATASSVPAPPASANLHFAQPSGKPLVNMRCCCVSSRMYRVFLDEITFFEKMC